MTSEQAKAAAEAMATLWEGELPATTKVLAAVKDDARDYRPDDKSRTAWELAVHLATADVWFLDSILQGRFEWNPDAAKKAEASFTSAREIAEFYERTVPARLGAVRALPADRQAEVLDFFGLMRMPRAQWIGFANNHSVHHRGQLSSYLRAMGSRVPNIYGPSADAEPVPASG